MKVMVYVEGPSDKLAMEALFRDLIGEKQKRGVAIRFLEAPKGNKKKSVLLKVPVKAAITIRNNPEARVVALPDLYPKNTGFPHETFEELRKGVLSEFQKALEKSKKKSSRSSDSLQERFKVFCFKYDLEALILASESPLKRRLGADSLKKTWRDPVEDQNHDRPPKRIVEDLFESHKQRYQGTVDAPRILGESDYHDLAEKCPQCFKPFVEFLSKL